MPFTPPHRRQRPGTFAGARRWGNSFSRPGALTDDIRRSREENSGLAAVSAPAPTARKIRPNRAVETEGALDPFPSFR